MAARYGRPAFPNGFENRLRKKKGSKTVEQQIAALLEPIAAHVVGLFFDLDDCRDKELPEGTPYPLSISIVYDGSAGGPNARQAAEKAANAMKDLFEKIYGNPEEATEVVLENCVAVADVAITLADLRKVDQWRLEYISLRENPPGHFIAADKMPS